MPYYYPPDTVPNRKVARGGGVRFEGRCVEMRMGGLERRKGGKEGKLERKVVSVKVHDRLHRYMFKPRSRK